MSQLQVVVAVYVHIDMSYVIWICLSRYVSLDMSLSICHIDITTTRNRVLQCVAVWCSVVQCIAVCCSVLQCTAPHCNDYLQHTTMYRNALQHTAAHCNNYLQLCDRDIQMYTIRIYRCIDTTHTHTQTQTHTRTRTRTRTHPYTLATRALARAWEGG